MYGSMSSALSSLGGRMASSWDSIMSAASGYRPGAYRDPQQTRSGFVPGQGGGRDQGLRLQQGVGRMSDFLTGYSPGTPYDPAPRLPGLDSGPGEGEGEGEGSPTPSPIVEQPTIDFSSMSSPILSQIAQQAMGQAPNPAAGTEQTAQDDPYLAQYEPVPGQLGASSAFGRTPSMTRALSSYSPQRSHPLSLMGELRKRRDPTQGR